MLSSSRCESVQSAKRADWGDAGLGLEEEEPVGSASASGAKTQGELPPLSLDRNIIRRVLFCGHHPDEIAPVRRCHHWPAATGGVAVSGARERVRLRTARAGKHTLWPSRTPGLHMTLSKAVDEDVLRTNGHTCPVLHDCHWLVSPASARVDSQLLVGILIS
jgi:hypothetical protein